jgi:hypothetical protein
MNSGLEQLLQAAVQCSFSSDPPTQRSQLLGGSALALRAIVVGIRAVIGAVVAGSVVGYEVCVHCDFSM